MGKYQVTLTLRDNRKAAREFTHESDANMLVAMAMLPPGTGDPLVAEITLNRPNGTSERWRRDHASGLWTESD